MIRSFKLKTLMVLLAIKMLWLMAMARTDRVLKGWGIYHLPMCERGSVLGGVVLIIITIVVLGTLIPVLWPMMTDTTTSIAALNGTDTATTFLKTGWPIILLLIGLAIVVGLIYFSLRQFGIGGKKHAGV